MIMEVKRRRQKERDRDCGDEIKGKRIRWRKER
jgi:hypothetical protein